jgi:hypothetical protein
MTWSLKVQVDVQGVQSTLTYIEALAKQKNLPPDPDILSYLHRLSRPGVIQVLVDDGEYRWCEGIYMEGAPSDDEIKSWPAVTAEDFAAEDWDCFEFVF